MPKSKMHWWSSEADQKNQRRIVLVSLAWIVPFLFADFAIENGWIESDGLAIATTVVVTILGVAVIATYRRFLQQADELMRKIQLDALGLAFGVGVVVVFMMSLLSSAAILTDFAPLDLVMVMIITYVASIVIGVRRYS